MVVSRREFIVAAAAAGNSFASAAQLPIGREIIRPETFGARGDGLTDDYAAFVRFVTALSNSMNRRAGLGRGKTYFIGRHATANNGVTNLIVRNAVGLTFEGNGATLSFDGSFDRSSAHVSGIGLAFNSCAGLRIFNLKLNGNAQNTTNSSRSIESAKAIALQINGCTDVQLDNIEAHHFATDGLRVGGAAPAPLIGSKRVTVTNYNAHHNGRCNIGVYEAENVTFKNCSSTYAGYTDGAYPGHSPLCGLDIEPDRARRNGTADLNTNNIRFEDCWFKNNKHSDINCVLDVISDVSFTRVRVESQDSPGSPSSIIVGCPGVIFKECHLDLGTRRLELSAGGTRKATHVFENCDILGSAERGSTLVSQFTSLETRFSGCRFRCTATAPKAHNFIAVNNRNFVFEGNKLFVPKAYFRDEGRGACKVFDVIMKRAMGNRYSTDLQHPNHYFYTKWNATEVLEETYVGTIPGRADTFRPYLGSTFDTRSKYSNRRISAAPGN